MHSIARHLLLSISFWFAIDTSPVLAQTPAELIQTAKNAISNKQYRAALDAFDRAFKLKESSYINYYDAACAAALAGDKQRAFEWLNQSRRLGWTNLDHLQTDSDLVSLHKDKRWKTLIADLKKLVAEKEKHYNQALKKELEDIYRHDQELRQQINAIQEKYGADSKELQALWEKISQTDEANLIKVEKILAKHGWVGRDEVGPKAASTLFLVIQHSNQDAMMKYVPLLRQAVKEKKAHASHLALMEDRIAINAGEKQTYGSQLSIIDGKTVLSPIIDPDHVDERRASMDLEPIADYIAGWKLTWDLTAYKKQMEEYDLAQRFEVTDFQKLSGDPWKGKSRFLDLDTHTWIERESSLTINAIESDSHQWRWHLNVTDDAANSELKHMVLSDNQRRLGQERILSRTQWPNSAVRVVSIQDVQDGLVQVRLRTTYEFDSSRSYFHLKKERKAADSQDYVKYEEHQWKP